jgi:recombinational DNA repair ATPase RecF
MERLIALRDAAVSDAERQQVESAIAKHGEYLATWRAKLAEILDAKAAATKATRASRLAAAAEKRRRKAERRLTHTSRVIQ